MITDDNDLIGNCSIDDANNVPLRRCDVFLLVVEIENQVLGRGSDVVIDALVSKPEVPLPKLVEVACCGTMAVESLEDRNGISV